MFCVCLLAGRLRFIKLSSVCLRGLIWLPAGSLWSSYMCCMRAKRVSVHVCTHSCSLLCYFPRKQGNKRRSVTGRKRGEDGEIKQCCSCLSLISTLCSWCLVLDQQASESLSNSCFSVFFLYVCNTGPVCLPIRTCTVLFLWEPWGGYLKWNPSEDRAWLGLLGKKRLFNNSTQPTRCNTSHLVSSAVPTRLSESPRPPTETQSQVPEFPSFLARIQQYSTRTLLLAKHNASEFQVITQKHNYGYYIQFLTLYPPKSHTLNI